MQLMETCSSRFTLLHEQDCRIRQYKKHRQLHLKCTEEEYLPETVRNYYDLEPVNTALREVHFPTANI